MASVGAVTVKVTPDLSAFREASADEIISEALNRHAEGLLHANLERMAADLLQKFYVVPKGI